MADGIAANQTSQSPLHLRITDGNLTATLGTFTFEAQVVALTPSATNYIFLDLSQEPPVLTVNTTGFPASAVWTIATAITNATKITQLIDSRPAFNKTFSGGGSPAGIQGDVQFNNNGVFGSANDASPGSTINLDTNVGNGLAVTIPNGGVFFQTSGFDVVSDECTFEATTGNVQFTADIASMFFNAALPVTFNSPTQILFQCSAGHYTFQGLQVFANNAAAQAGGLITGDFYRTGADPDVVCVVHP